MEGVAAVTAGQTRVIEELVADKGYHSNQTLVDLAQLDVRTYIAEPNRGRRSMEEQGRGPRRTHLRGHDNILKRLLVHTGGFNLGLLMQALGGVGTPQGLQGRLAAVMAVFVALSLDARTRPVA